MPDEKPKLPMAEPAVDHDLEPPTGVRHTLVSAILLLAQRVDDMDDKLDEMRRTTWVVVIREQLDRPIWPGKWEMRLGTLLVLLVTLVTLFGTDRVAGWLPSWFSPAPAGE